jgi:hypothetical protein
VPASLHGDAGAPSGGVDAGVGAGVVGAGVVGAETPGTGAPIRLLTFSTLFPNAARPNFGIFVENRLRHLLAGQAATSLVLAPVP